MTGTDTAPETGNRICSTVRPDGRMLNHNEACCHGCHDGLADSDSRGATREAVRLFTAH